MTPTSTSTRSVAIPATAKAAQASRPDRTGGPCLCGCGRTPSGRRSRFMPGHDNRHDPSRPGLRFNGQPIQERPAKAPKAKAAAPQAKATQPKPSGADTTKAKASNTAEREAWLAAQIAVA